MRLTLPDHLPQLSGAALATFRIVWVILFLLGLASSLYFGPAAGRRDTSVIRAYDEAGIVDWQKRPEGNYISPFSPEAHAAGIKRWDLLVAIDGRPAPADDDHIAAMLNRPDGAPLRLTLRSPGGTLRNVTIHHNGHFLGSTYARVGLTFDGRRALETDIRVAANLLSLVVCALLFVRRPRDPVAALLALGIAAGTVDVSGLFAGQWFGLAGQDWLGRGLGTLANASFALALLVFPSGRFVPRWTWLGVPLIAALLLVDQLSSVFPALGLPDTALGSIVLGVILAAVIARYRAEAPGISRQQVKFAVLGIALMVPLLIAGSICDLGVSAEITDQGVRAWLILGRSLFDWAGLIAVQLGLLISLLRYRLYDADTVLSRSAVVAALTLFLGIVFATSEKLIEAFGQTYFGNHGRTTAAAVSAAVAAVLIAPLHGRVHRWAERRFQKPLIALREGLPRLVSDLRETATPERIAEVALERIEHGVRAARGAVIMNGAVIAARGVGREEAKDEASDTLPVRFALQADGVGDVGELRLGPRPDGSLFGKDEREALGDVTGPLARALAIAATRATDAAERRDELSALKHLVKALERRLNRLAKRQITAS